MSEKINQLIDQLLALQLEVCENYRSKNMLLEAEEEREVKNVSKKITKLYKKMTVIRREIVDLAVKGEKK